MKIGVILPTYNVEKTLLAALGEVVKLLNEGSAELLIIDNASTDSSRQILKNFFAQNPVPRGSCTIRFHESNMGYGASIKAGFGFYLTQDVTHVLVLHSDAQTDNYKLAKGMMKVGAKFNTDVVLGTRFASSSDISDYSVLRKYGNYFFNWLTRATAGLRVSDAGSGMVLIPIVALKQINYVHLPEDWKFHPQLNIDLGRLDSVVIRELPMRWADSESRSSVPLFTYGISLLWMLLKAWVWGGTSKTTKSLAPLKSKSEPQSVYRVWPVEDFLDID
jgi:glycosyltransferase involved in cell wall biosynthesis